MKVVIDGTSYHIHLDRVAHKMQWLYAMHKDKVEQESILPGGVKFDFGRKSLLRSGVKSLLVPIILPILNNMFESKGLTIRPKVKHEDLIDYVVENVLTFMATTEKDMNFYVTTIEDNQSLIRHVTAISSTRPDAIGQPDGGDTERPEEETIEAD